MASIDELLRHPAVWRARDSGSTQPPGLPTGFSVLDRCLPGGGWPRHGLIEILVDSHGIGELSLLMPALAALCGEERDGGWLAWVAPPHQPYAPALAACGVAVDRVLVVRARPALWAMEQALRSSACRAVLGWCERDELQGMQGLRRLQLAAEQSQCLAVLFRGRRDAAEPSCAVLRLTLEADRGGITVCILKNRGARPASVWVSPVAHVVT
jgi:cell division inhibitor SulA/protein ImuA